MRNFEKDPCLTASLRNPDPPAGSDKQLRSSIRLIGSGSSSTVHRAHDVNTGRHVALKQFTRSADDEEVLQFIREEFYILRKFHHNNIVKPIRLEEDYADASNVRVVMILEYGGSLTLTQYVRFLRSVLA